MLSTDAACYATLPSDQNVSVEMKAIQHSAGFTATVHVAGDDAHITFARDFERKAQADAWLAKVKAAVVEAWPNVRS